MAVFDFKAKNMELKDLNSRVQSNNIKYCICSFGYFPGVKL